MTRTSREPMLAYTRMNQIPNSWRTSLVVALSRVLVIAFWVIVAIVLMKLCSWADEGSRNLPVTTPAGVHGKF